MTAPAATAQFASEMATSSRIAAAPKAEQRPASFTALEAASASTIVFSIPHLRSAVFIYHAHMIEERARLSRARHRRERRLRIRERKLKFRDYDNMSRSPASSPTAPATREDGQEEDVFERAERVLNAEHRRILTWEDEHDCSYGDLSEPSLLYKMRDIGQTNRGRWEGYSSYESSEEREDEGSLEAAREEEEAEVRKSMFERLVESAQKGRRAIAAKLRRLRGSSLGAIRGC